MQRYHPTTPRSLLLIAATGIVLNPDFEAPFMPAVEIGWRLGTDFWRCGYASEAALAALDFGFDEVGLDEIVAQTTVRNIRSRRVMERIGMKCDPRDDFDHPAVFGDSRVANDSIGQ